ncbi:P-loop containing nucleoside triphosphate hydrolase protein [Phycomyces nitens]|nr:P-loop containing nucleoside triphosphate hydrolase protein [Phycomyces nitens]
MTDSSRSTETFESFDFDPRLARAVAQLNFTHPTLVQQKVIPLALAGKDILARARTGSGKTAAYSMPIVEKILASKESIDAEPAIRALILVPTRELAEQVTGHINKLLVYSNQIVKVANLAGQVAPQLQRPLLAEKPDIIVATPSKALVHLEAHNMVLDKSLENLVIDEADLILSFGYEDDLRKILSFLPKIYQSFLMSATFTKDIEELKDLVLRKPVLLELDEDEDEAEQLSQYVIKCSEFEKFLYTFVIIKLRLIKGKVILFVNDIDRCYKLKLFLEQFSIKSCVLNSELPLNSRYHIVEEFNRGIYDYLIATDESELKGEQDSEDEDKTTEEKGSSMLNSMLSEKPKKKAKVQRDKEYGVSRGVDFQNVAAVINFDFPTSSKAYTHRVGRTARGGQRGMSLSFVVTRESMDTHKDNGRGNNVHDEVVYKRVQKQQAEKKAELKPYAFEKKNVDGFKYRVQDALKAVNKMAVKEARIKEIKREIMNSEKLKAHFEDKPKDLDFLRHDQALQPSKVQEHMKHIPSYLMPRVAAPNALAVDQASQPVAPAGPNVPFNSEKRRRAMDGKSHVKVFDEYFSWPKYLPFSIQQKRKADPLKSIKVRR